MRPILVNIPSKFLVGLLIALAAVGFALDLWRSRKESKLKLSSTPGYFLFGAVVLYLFKSSGDWTPLPIYAYGVMLGTSLIVGWFVAMRLARQDGIPEQDAGTIYMWTAVWSIIGSRVLWYITDPSPKSITDLLKVWQGGLVAYGGMIGGFLASWYGCHKRGIALLRWADVSAPSVVLGTGITRVGCLLFGCDYGARTDVPWAITFPGPNPDAATQLFPAGGLHGSPAWQHHIDQYHLAVSSLAHSYPVHPTQIYESLAGFFLFGVLMLIRRYRKFSGQVFLGWVLGYGILRPLIETVRADEDRGLYALPVIGVQLSTSQIIGLVSLVLGLALAVALARKYRRDPAGSRLWELPLVPPQAQSSAVAGDKRRKRR